MLDPFLAALWECERLGALLLFSPAASWKEPDTVRQSRGYFKGFGWGAAVEMCVVLSIKPSLVKTTERPVARPRPVVCYSLPVLHLPTVSLSASLYRARSVNGYYCFDLL